MKKFDLHIHTIPTLLDSTFDFSVEALEEYIDENRIDCIAITNHNLFDRAQFEIISERLRETVVFPGIEISLERGHLLVISPHSEITRFTEQCRAVAEKISSQTDFIFLRDFRDIFTNLHQYLLIPHYDKNPDLPNWVISELKKDILCGEVQSPKKFSYLAGNTGELTPLYFSDLRISDQLRHPPARFTYLSIDEISIPAIKTVLIDKSKVSLSIDGKHDLVQVLSNGLRISTGLTVVLGERSSGKTHTLDAIAESFRKPKYIKQFGLLARTEKEEEEKFSQNVSESKDLVVKDFLKPFQTIVEEIVPISLEDNESRLEEYLECLLRSGLEADKEDVYSKTKLFRESNFEIDDLSRLLRIIKGVQELIDNTEFRILINEYVQQDTLLRLYIALVSRYREENLIIQMKKYVNEVVADIKADLSLKTVAVIIPDFDFYKYLLDRRKVAAFRLIADGIKKSKEIGSKEMPPYRIVISARPYTGASELKENTHTQISLAAAFEKYKDAYEYLKMLINSGVQPSQAYLFFIKFECTILNKHGFRASGGERSEFNLLKQLADATQHDILLIDELESSFDNIFLSTSITRLLKEISSLIPVVISTHNSTLGASIMPDYLIYTKISPIGRDQVEHLIYSGYPTNKELFELSGDRIQNQNVQLDCLEAGKGKYYERKIIYENLED